MDRKACDAVTGIGSAFCDLCFLSKEEAHNQSMDLESTQQICNHISVKDDGDLVTARGDLDKKQVHFSVQYDGVQCA